MLVWARACSAGSGRREIEIVLAGIGDVAVKLGAAKAFPPIRFWPDWGILGDWPVKLAGMLCTSGRLAGP